MLRTILFLVLCVCSGIQAAKLETVTDDELLYLIKTEKYVVALFTKPDCEACDNYENVVLQLREDMVDALSAWVVKVVKSQMRILYTTEEEPALVFFRHGYPLLYDGRVYDEDMLAMFTENKEPLVKELTDDTFEHLTQASSGATTGDWFIMFYSTDSVDSMRMAARWETVAAKLKQRVNVACVNKYTTGASTARRFNIYEVPEFIFFRHGKMYRYVIPRYDINAFVAFTKDWYKHVHAERVPVPQSPFDDFTQMIANFLRENVWVMKLGSISIGVLVIVSVAAKLRRKSESPQKKEK